jgi:Glycogen recognition site of AMP-activated protein kinase
LKPSASIQNKKTPSPFNITDHNEYFAFILTSKFPTTMNTPFTDLMQHPEKLEAAFKNARNANDAFEASRMFGQSPINPKAPAVLPENNGAQETSGNSQPELKITEFHLEAPFAKSVKLAADFTEWGKSPLDMMKSEDGLWFITVPLPPGPCSYRFIVDGRWFDDPRRLCLQQFVGHDEYAY